MTDDMMKLRALAEKTPAEQLMEMEVGAPAMPPGLDRKRIGLSPKCRISAPGGLHVRAHAWLDPVPN